MNKNNNKTLQKGNSSTQSRSRKRNHQETEQDLVAAQPPCQPSKQIRSRSSRGKNSNSQCELATDNLTRMIKTRSKGKIKDGEMLELPNKIENKRKISMIKSHSLEFPGNEDRQNDDQEEEDPEEYDRVQVTVDVNSEDEASLDYDEWEEEQEENGTVETEEEIPRESDLVDSEVTFNLKPMTMPKLNQEILTTLVSEEEIDNARSLSPAFQTYIKRMVARELEAERKREQLKKKPETIGKSTAGIASTPNIVGKRGLNQNMEIVKSPSDTTIYAPALNRVGQIDKTRQIVDKIINDECKGKTNNYQQNDTDLANQITHFIEGVRLESSSRDMNNKPSAAKIVDDPKPSTSGAAGGDRDPHHDTYSESIDVAKQRANQMVLDAERFKATVNAPNGMYQMGNVTNIGHRDLVGNVNDLDPRDILPTQNPTQQNLGGNTVMHNTGNGLVNHLPNANGPVPLDDDEFFHVTCHVEPNLRSKIERGEFVELERLLPKPKSVGFAAEENRMSLVQRDGQVYFVPSPNGSKITGVRKWEQAFRVYAAIYSQANPTRAAEIWQYVHVINVAASGYIWDNVAQYDITFRHLMAQNPFRSWAKIYGQMWNMSMRDVLPRSGPGFGNFTNSNNNYKKGNGNNKGQKKKYCWAHNRGQVCKDGADKCKFIHRCSYCDKADHEKSTCPTKKNN